uniref:Gastrin/cholecystokinin peptide hormone domain-containing protein n=1 Tax=Denticeps clupeoides TaxID=299321 RepID=A0AAY4DEG6_9TELE
MAVARGCVVALVAALAALSCVALPAAREARHGDQRDTVDRQIMQALSGECFTDRDYQGWVDFGRRSAD